MLARSALFFRTLLIICCLSFPAIVHSEQGAIEYDKKSFHDTFIDKTPDDILKVLGNPTSIEVSKSVPGERRSTKEIKYKYNLDELYTLPCKYIYEWPTIDKLPVKIKYENTEGVYYVKNIEVHISLTKELVKAFRTRRIKAIPPPINNESLTISTIRINTDEGIKIKDIPNPVDIAKKTYSESSGRQEILSVDDFKERLIGKGLDEVINMIGPPNNEKQVEVSVGFGFKAPQMIYEYEWNDAKKMPIRLISKSDTPIPDSEHYIEELKLVIKFDYYSSGEKRKGARKKGEEVKYDISRFNVKNAKSVSAEVLEEIQTEKQLEREKPKNKVVNIGSVFNALDFSKHTTVEIDNYKDGLDWQSVSGVGKVVDVSAKGEIYLHAANTRLRVLQLYNIILNSDVDSKSLGKGTTIIFNGKIKKVSMSRDISRGKSVDYIYINGKHEVKR